MLEQGPFILDDEHRPILVSPDRYVEWLESLQNSTAWCIGGWAWETICIRSDWLPGGVGAINTRFTPYAPVDSRGPKVFETSVSYGLVKDGRFVDIENCIDIYCERYHTRGEALSGHQRFLTLVASEGIQAIMFLFGSEEQST
jgi:hypothetical protein